MRYLATKKANFISNHTPHARQNTIDGKQNIVENIMNIYAIAESMIDMVQSIEDKDARIAKFHEIENILHRIDDTLPKIMHHYAQITSGKKEYYKINKIFIDSLMFTLSKDLLLLTNCN